MPQIENPWQGGELSSTSSWPISNPVASSISSISTKLISTFQIGVRGKLHWKVLHAVKLISIPSNSLNPANDNQE